MSEALCDLRSHGPFDHGPHPHSISLSDRRSASDYGRSSCFLAGPILRTTFSRVSCPAGSGSKVQVVLIAGAV
jgi:hypothetical protein